MKIKTLAAALAFCLLCCSALPMTAYAAEDQTSASTSVLYTIQGGYTVNIPASINLNNSEKIQISASELSLPSGKDLVVRLVSTQTFDDQGAFYLTSSSGAKLHVTLCRAGYDGQMSSFLWEDDCLKNPEVAIFSSYSFKDGNVYIPEEYGQLSFVLGDVTGLVAGQYSGTLRFSIRLEDQ